MPFSVPFNNYGNTKMTIYRMDCKFQINYILSKI